MSEKLNCQILNQSGNVFRISFDGARSVVRVERYDVFPAEVANTVSQAMFGMCQECQYFGECGPEVEVKEVACSPSVQVNGVHPDRIYLHDLKAGEEIGPHRSFVDVQKGVIARGPVPYRS